MPWFYLSFADGDRPKGQQWLGACHVEADNFVAAVTRSWEARCNPGGEVRGLELPVGVAPPEAFCDRLMSRADLEEFDRAIGGRGAVAKWPDPD
jgi:hypothetical protein